MKINNEADGELFSTVQVTPMIIVPGGVAPQFEGDYSQPIWSLFACRPADDDDTDAATWSPHEWTDDGDGGEFYEVAARLTHAACELLAVRLLRPRRLCHRASDRSRKVGQGLHADAVAAGGQGVYQRCEFQGGTWYLARRMRVLEPVDLAEPCGLAECDCHMHALPGDPA